jgi:hypothetical protein
MDLAVDWSSLPFHVVRNATALVLGYIQEICGDSCFIPKDIRPSSKSRTSERLARVILKDLAKTGIPKAAMLYPTGDKDKDMLPRALAEGSITLTSLQVYETHGFVRDLENAVRSTLLGEWNTSDSLFVIPTRQGSLSLLLAAFLCDKMNIVAAKLTPEDIVKAVVDYDNQDTIAQSL